MEIGHFIYEKEYKDLRRVNRMFVYFALIASRVGNLSPRLRLLDIEDNPLLI